MSTQSILPGRRATAVLLVVAALGELVEAAFSPLRGGSTADDLRHIAAHQGLFAVTVLVGLVSTLLYIPGFLGLADACRVRSPRLARVSGWLAVGAMCGFVAVRMGQAVELQTVRDGLSIDSGAALVDHVTGNPIAAPLLVLFLGGGLIGLVTLAVALWRAGFPRPACVLLACFQLIDLTVPSRLLVSHLLLLVALAWCAVALWSPARAESRPAEATEPVAV
jgi:hypothetical protein